MYFKKRSFLKEKDFTKEELMYLIDFSAHLKDMKKKGSLIVILKERILPYYLKKHQRVRVPLSLLPQLTWEPIQNI